MSKLLICLLLPSIALFSGTKTSIHNQNALEICYHNGREGISYDDILEHIGNGEYGSAWRDAKEKEEVRDFFSNARDNALSALEIIGDGLIKD